MADPTKEERQATLRRFLEAAQVPNLVERKTDGLKVFASNYPGGFEVEINPYLGTIELIFTYKCQFPKGERDRLQGIANSLCNGHEFYKDKFAGMSPEEAANWGKGTSQEANY